METRKQPAATPTKVVVDARCKPRFKIEVGITVYTRSSGAVKGHTVDLSESGVAAILKIEVPLGELVELEFKLPLGQVITYATGRQRSAFRYGFQFVESNGVHPVIRATCRNLEVERTLFGEL